jgi:type IV pilus assembly protein PilV
MLNLSRLQYTRQRGVSLVEVLVTLVILAFGLLGVAGLQAKMSVAEMESYQRSQALMALAEMTERMSANPALATSYLNQGTLGNGNHNQPANCNPALPTAPLSGPARDLCEWNISLQGASEQNSAAAKVGGMMGAVGCITQLTASNPALGVCTAGIYQVSVAWQGMNPTKAPAAALSCGLGSYGANEANRRVITATVTVGTTSCF